MSDELDRYVDLLLPFYDQDQARQWLHTGQPLLGGAVPVDLIRNGQAQRVLALIFQLRDGAYV